MSITIRYEVQLLLGSLALGICLMAVYDGLRLLRRLIRHKNIWTGAEDVLYWSLSSIVTFLLLFEQNDGVLRAYAIAGVLSGMVLYNSSVSKILHLLLKKIRKYYTMRKKKERRNKLWSRRD